ncbi:hypothetical protein LC087_16465 [Bacillus carboniphilus]|uniref:Immunity protein 30 domain-containing protein n=1 Tax=Bacillus carboniphilus TaxID=86663 RepID=A0ABY9JSB3_9BACI|nr:hypothetical protein [Bacillus carboniphilus]WLR42295.1 hypothetical protein LC087_16465 [Bacillus carboniphilus]
MRGFMDIKTIAEVYRLGLAAGFYTIQDVIKWADNLIEKVDEPPYEIIEVSLSSREKPYFICAKLKELTAFTEEELPTKILLGLINKYYEETEDMTRIDTVLSILINYIPASCEWIELELHSLLDEYYLAEQKIYGNSEEVKDRIKNFLSQFQKYSQYHTELQSQED